MGSNAGLPDWLTVGRDDSDTLDRRCVIAVTQGVWVGVAGYGSGPRLQNPDFGLLTVKKIETRITPNKEQKKGDELHGHAHADGGPDGSGCALGRMALVNNISRALFAPPTLGRHAEFKLDVIKALAFLRVAGNFTVRNTVANTNDHMDSFPIHRCAYSK